MTAFIFLTIRLYTAVSFVHQSYLRPINNMGPCKTGVTKQRVMYIRLKADIVKKKKWGANCKIKRQDMSHFNYFVYFLTVKFLPLTF